MAGGAAPNFATATEFEPRARELLRTSIEKGLLHRRYISRGVANRDLTRGLTSQNGKGTARTLLIIQDSEVTGWEVTRGPVTRVTPSHTLLKKEGPKNDPPCLSQGC